MGRPKLRVTLADEKGKVPYLEKQKKLRKEARKRKRTQEEEEDSETEAPVNGVKSVEEMDVDSDEDEEEEWEDDESEDENGGRRNIDTSRLEDSDSSEDSEDDEEEDEDDEEEEAVLAKLLNGSSKKSSKADAEDDEEEEDDEDEDEEDIPLSDIDEDEADPEADMIPRQRLTIDNHPALLASYSSIALLPATSKLATSTSSKRKDQLAFTLHQSVTTEEPVEIKDVDDDLTRELAFYTQALSAAKNGRELLLAEGVPFTRPTDYFAEMVKSEEHMGKIKEKMKLEAARKQASSDAKRQRDLKKFGKQVQIAKLQERHKEKRETLDKIKMLKRKRAGADLGDANEDDPFDVAIEKADKAINGGRDRRGKGDRGAPNAKRQKKNEKFGFGGRKKFAKSGDAVSSGDLSGFNTKGMKRNSFGGPGGKKGKAPRPGKSKRQGRK